MFTRVSRTKQNHDDHMITHTVFFVVVVVACFAFSL
jgi:hypothetical protein